MATIRSYTTIEQSKVLAEILPIESADMCYIYLHTEDKEYEDIPICAPAMEGDLCAWSLAALLGILHDYTLQTNADGTVFVVCENKKPMISEAYDNPIDACYEMILKLHELKML